MNQKSKRYFVSVLMTLALCACSAAPVRERYPAIYDGMKQIGVGLGATDSDWIYDGDGPIHLGQSISMHLAFVTSIRDPQEFETKLGMTECRPGRIAGGRQDYIHVLNAEFTTTHKYIKSVMTIAEGTGNSTTALCRECAPTFSPKDNPYVCHISVPENGKILVVNGVKVYPAFIWMSAQPKPQQK